MRFRPFSHAAPLVLLVLAGCHHGHTLRATHAWVRLAAVPGNPAAAYLTLHGGPEDARLIAVDSDAAGSSELHRSMKTGPGGAMTGQMTGMQRLDGLDLPAHGWIDFAPGGNHVMLFGVSPAVKPGGHMTLAIRFEKGQPLQADALVVGAGDPAPY
jgi:copper(I)-binding protein